jgi:hypothetical protein
MRRSATSPAGELLNLGPDSPILVTACGSYGDPGIANNYWLFSLEGDSLERLRRSEGHYRRCLRERNLWLGRAGYQFVPNIALLSQLTGIDNRALLPPYFPLFRNEDFLFGFMTQLLHPDALMLDLPWAIAHLPDPPRRWEADAVDSPAYSGILSFTAEALYGLRTSWPSRSPEDRLAAAAAQLRDFAAMPEAGLRQWFTPCVTDPHQPHQPLACPAGAAAGGAGLLAPGPAAGHPAQPGFAARCQRLPAEGHPGGDRQRTRRGLYRQSLAAFRRRPGGLAGDPRRGAAAGGGVMGMGDGDAAGKPTRRRSARGWAAPFSSSAPWRAC